MVIKEIHSVMCLYNKTFNDNRVSDYAWHIIHIRCRSAVNSVPASYLGDSSYLSLKTLSVEYLWVS
jgi:hypothetical protein